MWVGLSVSRRGWHLYVGEDYLPLSFLLVFLSHSLIYTDSPLLAANWREAKQRKREETVEKKIPRQMTPYAIWLRILLVIFQLWLQAYNGLIMDIKLPYELTSGFICHGFLIEDFAKNLVRFHMQIR